MIKIKKIFRFFLPITLMVMAMSQLHALTVKDLVTIQGVQENEITGFSLVVGLEGTGDKKNSQKERMVRDYLYNKGLGLSAEDVIDSKNTAVVSVTGKLPPYAGKGQKIPLTVSTFGDSKSLEGGVLLFTQLTYAGAKNELQTVFATAQGPLQIVEGLAKTTAKVEGIVYTPVPATTVKNGMISLMLEKPDDVDADRIARQINQYFIKSAKFNVAKAVSAGMIKVQLPQDYEDKHVSFIAQLKKIPVLLTDEGAKIIINSKTNMVMLNEKIEVSPFSFTYNDLNVNVTGARAAPNINSQWINSVGSGNLEKNDLQNLVDSLNEMRVSPKEMVEIIKYAHKIGAVKAKLIIE